MCELLNYTGKECHIIYKNIFKNTDNKARHHGEFLRRNVETLWEKFRPYADNHFVKEFCINPDQRYWEMYVGCCLLSQDIQVSSKNKGPDFNFKLNGRNISIEAVAPTMGNEDSADKVPESVFGKVSSVPKDKIILRYRSALSEKENKFNEYTRKGVVGKKDIKIIAVSSGAIRGWNKSDTLPFIFSALFPIGDAYLSLSRDTGQIVDQGYQFQPSIAKANGKNVGTMFFADPLHSDISAVIYSETDIGNPSLNLGEDLLIIHNPLAVNPLPKDLLAFGKEYWIEIDGDMWVLKDNKEFVKKVMD